MAPLPSAIFDSEQRKYGVIVNYNIGKGAFASSAFTVVSSLFFHSSPCVLSPPFFCLSTLVPTLATLLRCWYSLFGSSPFRERYSWAASLLNIPSPQPFRRFWFLGRTGVVFFCEIFSQYYLKILRTPGSKTEYEIYSGQMMALYRKQCTDYTVA